MEEKYEVKAFISVKMWSIYRCDEVTWVVNAKTTCVCVFWLLCSCVILPIDPPNEPEITGYTNGQVIQTNHTLKLVCVARGGNPLAQVRFINE